MLAWKSFDFFKSTQLPQQFNSHQIEVITSNNGLIAFGDGDGVVHVVSGDGQQELCKIQAHNIITHLLIVSDKSHLVQYNQNTARSGSEYLLSCGMDEENIPLLKVWSVTGELIKTIVVEWKDEVHTVTAMCANSLQQCLIGLNNGMVLIYQGNLLQRYRVRTLRLSHSITDIQSVDGVHFIATQKKGHAYDFNFNPMYTDLGCNIGCSTILNDNFILCRSDAMYSFNADGRGPAFALDGHHVLSCDTFKSYIVTVSCKSQQELLPQKVRVYDLKNKLIAYAESFNEPVYVAVTSSLYVFVSGTVRKIEEMDFGSKMQLLYSKELYPTALSIIRGAQYPAEVESLVVMKYGDFLYNKGKYEEAMQQYCETIGNGVEPSVIIKQFIDGDKIKYLTTYLEALHQKQIASYHHTTLLLHCYTKIKDFQKLEKFIGTQIKCDSQQDQATSPIQENQVYFDAEAALAVCRENGLYEQAVQLAIKFGLHDIAVTVMLEDLNDYAQCLNYMERNLDQSFNQLQKYGATLYQFSSSQTQKLMVDLCSPPLNKDPFQLLPSLRLSDNDSIKILEQIQTNRQLAGNDNSLVLMKINEGLLDLYLSCKDQDYTDKILGLLQSTVLYDQNKVLASCKQNNNVAAQLYILEMSKQYKSILDLYCEIDDYDKVMSKCIEYSPVMPSLWVDALKYFVQKQGVVHFIKDCIAEIHTQKLLSLGELIDTLAINDECTFDLVRDILLAKAELDQAMIAENESKTSQLLAECEQVKSEISQLKSGPYLLQNNECSICKGVLELPCVHFLCKHSFHTRCIQVPSQRLDGIHTQSPSISASPSPSYAADLECPLCEPEYSLVKEIREHQEMSSKDIEQFRHKLSNSTDAFSVIASYLGRGTFLYVNSDDKNQQNQ
ncbi:hypothetical protein MP228_006720 [Amoeboaphelidium protococcarum]|nr:hypothetical protein MP228_006720 [Amoeboaphelidium protococcarum]